MFGSLQTASTLCRAVPRDQSPGELLQAAGAGFRGPDRGRLVREEPLAADPAVPSLGHLALRSGASLAGVLLLIVLLAVLVKRFRLPASIRPAGGRVSSIDRLDLGARREVRLLRVDGRMLVVGVTADRIELLTQYAAEDSLDSVDDEDAPSLQVLRNLVTSS